MAKMRVHEIAKEIDVTSKDVLACLEEAGISGKTASSSLEDDQIGLVKKKFGKGSAIKPEASKAAPVKEAAVKESAVKESAAKEAAAKPEGGRPAADGVQAPVKKKRPNIILVSNPHNSQDGRRGGYHNGRPQQNGSGRTAQKPDENHGRPQGRINLNVKPLAPGESRLLQEREQQAMAARRSSNVENETRQPEVRKPENNVENKVQPAVQTRQTDSKRPVASDRGAGNPVRDSRGSQEPARERTVRPQIQTQGDRRGSGRPQVQTQSDRRGAYNNSSRPQGGRPGQGGFGGRPQGGRPGQGGFGGRPGQGGFGGRPQDGRFGSGRPGAGRPGFAAESKESDHAKRGDQNRRQNNNDKRNKEKTYVAEDGFRGGKSNKGKQLRHLERPQERRNEVKEEEKIKVIVLPEVLTLKELADQMKIQPAVIIKKLFLQGKVVTVNQEISYEQAEEIAVEFDILCEKEVVVDVIEELLKEEEEDEALMTKRAPVICVMGHVDHGKTSLLDAIRKTHVIDREAGGITQAIGAYVVHTKGQKITFLDTPGHEAFTAMRMRGANSTDIAILVVAADDGVMPQTVEAINHAKAAGIEIVVAVNKIDKPGANIERVKQELSEYELIPEDWGGSTVFAPVSAKSGEGIDNLLDMILLTSEIMELKANAKRSARGIVIEAELDKGRGPVATVLVQKGTLHVGDFIAAGACHGKVRAMIDDKGRRVKEAEPSTPVEILGLNDVPNAGEVFVSPGNDKEAKNFAQTFIAQNKVKLLDDTKNKMSLDDLFSQIQAGNLKELNLIIKADVQGSVEAVKESLLKLSNEEVIVKCIHGGVGAINESDVILASASNAIIIGFNVRPDATAKATAESEGVDVRLYDVIYKAIEDVEAAMKGMLDPVFEEKVIGHAEIRQIFKASGIGNIAGSYILDGVFCRNCLIRISHEGEMIHEGKLASLKRFKDDVKEVKSGFECGLVFEDFQDFSELDVVEAYVMEEVPRS